jgi:glycosyltransferase involved in cell wall biosynthesis
MSGRRSDERVWQAPGAMRICLVYDCLFPHTVGGAERWYANLAERLAREGHEVTYLTLRQWEKGETPQIDPRVRVVVAGPRMALYTESGRRRILPPLVFGAGVLAHLLRRGRRYEVVHTCSFPYFSLLAAALARPLARYRLVVDWFEVWSRTYWREYLGGAAGAIGALVQRVCALVPQRAFCFSRLHAERLRGEGLRGEVRVLRGLYGGSLEPHSPRPAQDGVLFAGRLIPEKRAPLAVAAVAAASRLVEELRGEFLGEGPEREALERAIDEQEMRGAISAPGFLSAEEVEARMRGAMCMLLTSEREGYGMVVVEAARWGTPSVVVAGPDNAAVELVEEGVNGFVAPVAQAESIGAAIARVSEGGMVLRESTARWFAEHAQELSIERSLGDVLESYEALSART